MKTVFILLGGNIGDTAMYFQEAIQKISELGKMTFRSSTYESEPWGFEASQRFLNQVVELQSSLSPQDLLNSLLSIEQQLGRERNEATISYTSRVIDLDILYYSDQVISTPTLTIPHPKLQERRFTLAPLVEIAPRFVHPLLRKTNKELLQLCPDHSVVLNIAKHA